MELNIFHIDSFSNSLFKGNPACVVPLDEWLPDDVLLKIAQENAVAETAFIRRNKRAFDLRWFTPDLEMDLCGHATLAAAHAIKTRLNFEDDFILFNTQSGVLKVDFIGDKYRLDFPARPPQKSALPIEIKGALSIQPVLVLKAERDYILVYDSEEEIRNLVVNQNELDKINLGQGGVAVTARGDKFDFVSRFFTPQATILEDPVTGSSHCSLVPYWSEVLLKKELVACQLSDRSGILYCTDLGSRILIAGAAVTYSVGKILL